MASEPIFIPDNQEFTLDQFLLPKNVEREDISSILIPGGTVRNRIKTMAKEIRDDYHNRDLLLVCILNGAYQFFTDLVHYIDGASQTGDNPFYFKFLPVNSYKDDKSTGTLNIGEFDPRVVTGKDLLIVEDIVDSGNTAVGKKFVPGVKPTGGLFQYFMEHNPHSIEMASMTVKRTTASNGFKPKYSGFSVPDKFLVGYGLDFNQRFRTLNHICVVSPTAIQKYNSD